MQLKGKKYGAFSIKIGVSFSRGGASVAHFGVQLGAFSKFSSGDTAWEGVIFLQI